MGVTKDTCCPRCDNKTQLVFKNPVNKTEVGMLVKRAWGKTGTKREEEEGNVKASSDGRGRGPEGDGDGEERLLNGR